MQIDLDDDAISMMDDDGIIHWCRLILSLYEMKKKMKQNKKKQIVK